MQQGTDQIVVKRRESHKVASRKFSLYQYNKVSEASLVLFPICFKFHILLLELQFYYDVLHKRHICNSIFSVIVFYFLGS